MPLIVTYLILVAIISTVIIVVNLVSEPTVEIINGFPFVTDIPGLDVSAMVNATERNAQPRSVQSIRFVRLVPVPDHPAVETKLPSETYSLGREDQDGSVLPAIYYRIFSELDLMSRLEMGTCYYTIY
jgi:hypothetical protein